jgi:hypothetical protein
MNEINLKGCVVDALEVKYENCGFAAQDLSTRTHEQSRPRPIEKINPRRLHNSPAEVDVPLEVAPMVKNCKRVFAVHCDDDVPFIQSGDPVGPAQVFPVQPAAMKFCHDLLSLDVVTVNPHASWKMTKAAIIFKAMRRLVHHYNKTFVSYRHLQKLTK